MAFHITKDKEKKKKDGQILVKESGLKIKDRKSTLPKKRTINLANVGEKPVKKTFLIPAILAIVIFAGLTSKVLVIDRLAEINKRQAENSQLQAEIDKDEKLVNDATGLSENYAHYTYEGMTDTETSMVDRTAILDLIDQEVLPYADIGAWKLSDNVLELPISSANLEDTNKIVEKLEKNDIVDYVTVSNAVLDDQTQTILSSDELSKYKSDVTATISVYLTRDKEGDENE